MLQITDVAGLGTLQMLQTSWIQRKARGQACSTWGGTGGLAGPPMGTQEEQLMLMMLVQGPKKRAKRLRQDAQGEQLMLMMLAPVLRETLEKHRQRCKYC